MGWALSLVPCEEELRRHARSMLRYSSEGGYLRPACGRLGQLGVMLAAYGNLPRPESWFPYVFNSPKEAAEAGVCELSSQSLIVKRKLHPLCKKLGIAPRGLHAFRHGQGTLLDQMHVPVKVRQQRLGHTSAELTLNTYTHVITSDERKFADELGEILHANAPKKENGSRVDPPKPLYLN